MIKQKEHVDFTLICMLKLMKYIIFFTLLQNSWCDSFDRNATFEKGLGQLNEGKISLAIDYFSKSMKKGDEKSAFYLGSIYYYGDGVFIDYTKAMYYFEIAANRGSLAANFMIGLMYAEGHGVDKDLKKTVKYFDIATNKRE